MKRIVLSLVAAAAFGVPATGQEIGNPDAGKALAEANCSQCHNIAPGGAFQLHPPSFTAIVKYLHPDVLPLRIMYPYHENIMPRFNTYMHPTNLRDLVAYMRSLDE